jgi:hypothetical protein
MQRFHLGQLKKILEIIISIRYIQNYNHNKIESL